MGLGKDLERKIAIRREAARNSGDPALMAQYGIADDDGAGEARANGPSPTMRKLSRHVRALHAGWALQAIRTIPPGRGFGAKLVVLAKRARRKAHLLLAGWFFRPLVAQQSDFNGNAANALTAVEEALAEVRFEADRRHEALSRRADEAERRAEALAGRADEAEKRADEAERRAEALARRVAADRAYVLGRLGLSVDPERLEGAALDYGRFEDAFRGPREEILASQSLYVDWFRGTGARGVVLDLGCGRGEFLELLAGAGISAVGLERDPGFVADGRARGLRVESAEALDWLAAQPDGSLGGILMAHVVEHVAPEYMAAVVRLALGKLLPGAPFVVETPNPEALAIYRTFPIDPGHRMPVPYLYLEHLFRSTGYASVERFDNPRAASPVQLPVDREPGFATLQAHLYANQDYTLVARR